MYQEYLAEFWYSSKALENSKVSFSIPTGGIYGEVGLNTFRNAIGAHHLPHSSKYVAPPSIDVVRKWFLMIVHGEEDIILKLKKKQREKVVPYTRFLSLLIMHKMKEDCGTNEDQQATGGPTSLGVTSQERANPQLSSGHDGSADFIAEADPGLSAPNDSIPPQQDQTKSISEGLETVLTQPTTKKGASSTAIHGDKEEASTAIHGDKEEASSTIKLEDLAKLVSQIQPSFKDLDLPEDDPIIIVGKSDEDEQNAKTEDTSSQKYKLELEKNKAEAEAALLKAQTSFLNVEQLNKLLDLPSKFNELTEEIKGLKTQVYELKIELPKELKEIPTKLEDFTKTATTKVELAQAKLKALDALLSLFLNVTKALNKFAEVLESTSRKARDQGVPSARQADTMPAEGEKDTNQATIS
nr:hypothetical protein [Tanacetum cinerariifolium]